MAYKERGFWIPDPGVSQYGLTTQQKLDNANIIYRHFRKTGWTKNAICAMLGNMDVESRMNPHVYNQDSLGLVQWHPASKLTEYATAIGEDPLHGTTQMLRIDYELVNGLQWDPNHESSVTFDDFVRDSTTPLDRMVHLWRWLYEVADPATEPERLEWAQFYLDNVTRRPPIWMLFKIKERRNSNV